MKNTFYQKLLPAVILLFVAFNCFSDDSKTEKKPILKNKTTNPDYDPNKGIMGKPKEEKIVKRTRNEPIIKNRKYEPVRIQKNK